MFTFFLVDFNTHVFIGHHLHVRVLHTYYAYSVLIANVVKCVEHT